MNTVAMLDQMIASVLPNRIKPDFVLLLPDYQFKTIVKKIDDDFKEERGASYQICEDPGSPICDTVTINYGGFKFTFVNDKRR